MGLTKPRASQIYNLDYKQATRVVTTTNITLSGGAPNQVDGVTLTTNDRILVTGQITASQNGLYLVTTAGSGSNGTWARTSDGNETGEIDAGMIIMVTEGTIYADTQWKLITDNPIDIGTTSLIFTQNYSANSISGGTSNVTVYSNANVTISSAGTANVVNVGNTAVTFTGNLFPSANVTYSLGNTALRWKDLWLANSTLYIGDVTVATNGSALTVNGANVLVGNAGSAFSTSGNITGGNILTDGLISATGNVTGNYILGNGSQLTGLPATYSNSNVSSFLADFGSNTISTTGTVTAGNITGSNILTGGLITATGNVTGGNVLTGGLISATGNVAGGNLLTSGLVSATGNITGAKIISNGDVSVTGNVAIAFGGTFLYGSATVTDTIGAQKTTGQIAIGGPAQTGAIFLGQSLANSSVYVGYGATANANTKTIYLGGGGATGSTTTINIGPIAAAGTTNFGANTIVAIANTGGSALSVAGNVTGGNILTAGLISATGSIIGAVISIPAGALTLTNQGSVNDVIAGTKNVGQVIIGGTTQTGAITVGQSTATQSLSLASGVTSSGNTKTISIGQSGAAGSNTNITMGPSAGVGTVNIGSGTTMVVANTSGTALSVAGNITGGNISATNHTGTNVSVTGTQTAASTVGGVITGTSTSVTGTQTAASTVGGVITGSSVSVTGNVTGANVTTPVVNNDTAMTVSTGAGNINLQPAGNIVLSNKYINGLNQPVQDNDAASKIYVDNLVSTQISYHQAVTAATTTTLATTTGGTITYTQPNGVSNGVGAYIQTTGSFTTIDTANVQTVGTRILVKDEANATFNGVYTYSNATAIVRSTDADEYGANSAVALSLNDYFFVTSGNVNAGSAWIVDAPSGTITFGTSNIAFAQFSQSQVYTAGNGISINGTVISAKVDNNTTAFDGGGNISVKAGANLTTPNIGAATGTSLSVTGTVTSASVAGGVITGLSTSVTGTQTAASTVGGVITGSSVSVTGTATATSTVGGVITGSSTSVTGTTTAASVVGGVITGSSVSVTGTQTAASTVGGVITGSSASLSGNVTGGNLLTGGLISATGNITGGNILGNGAGLSGINVFSTVSVSGGNSAVASTIADTLTLIAGTGMAITANAAADSITFSSVSTTSIFATGGDMGTVTEAVTSSENLGLITDPVTVSYNLGTIAVNGVVTNDSIADYTITGTKLANNFVYGSDFTVTGNVTGGNLISTGNIFVANVQVLNQDQTLAYIFAF